MTAAYFNLRGRYRSLGRSFRIPHITHRSAAYFCRIHSANYFPHAAFPQITIREKYRTCLSVNSSAMVTRRKACDMSKVLECCRQKGPNLQGSKVYCAFLDATKAFDKVLHSGIYKKLLDRCAPLSLVYLLQNWYSNLQCRVKWNNVLGDLFAVLCGVRQDGVLSPALFALYVDDLVSQLRLWLWYSCWLAICRLRSLC